jgi:hypothetical protein
MKTDFRNHLHFALVVCLIAFWLAAPALASDVNDPRARQLALAIGYAMSGQQDCLSAIEGVETGAVLKRIDEKLADPDFYLAGAYIHSFTNANAKGCLSGLIYHRDGLSRIILTGFKAAFREDARLAITRLDLSPTYTPTPRTSLYFVPAEKASADSFRGLAFKKALLKANRHAIPSEGRRGDSRPRAYTVVAFMMDRQPPDVQMEIAQSTISGSASGARRHRGQNQDGWCYTVLPATFAYSQGEENFFNIFLHVNKNLWLANTYSTHSLLMRTQQALAQRGYDPGPADGQMGAQTRRAIERFQKQQGLPMDGQPSLALLALLRATDWPPAVPLVQTSLTMLGYDPGPIDGQMGRQTAGAIRAYQNACGMSADGKLSAGLLCHLAEAAGPLPAMTGGQGLRVKRFTAKMWPNMLGTP